MLDVHLLVDGAWRPGGDGGVLDISNPSTARVIGRVAVASTRDLEDAVAAAKRGFEAWSGISPFERSRVLRRAAAILRERTDAAAEVLSAEQGKPIAQARAEISGSADTIEWFAEEGRRCFGQVIAGRESSVHVLTRLEPVGPVAAFAPWNFPVSQSVKKLAAALGAGCSIILKGPEETPAACAELVKAFVDAGVPPGAIGLLYGEPAQISRFLITHPIIRAVTFTGSVPVGKQLAGLAGSVMKRVTMELGGHAPAIVCADANLPRAAAELARMKFMNAGQVCLAPTRFLVARSIYEQFIDLFCKRVDCLKVDGGRADKVDMGPLASERRVRAMEAFVEDAVAGGASIVRGGRRFEREGYFFAPTVLRDVPIQARAMNEEPFGPLALFRPFDDIGEAVTEANRLPYGLASYVYTSSISVEASITEHIEAGMVAVNRIFSSAIEAPFGGVKDSGYGTEGGTEAIRNFLNEKMITRFVG